MANFTLSVADHSARLLRESKTVILISVGEMSFRVELDFSSCPVSGETFDELETCTPESPVEEISIIKSAFSGDSTKVNLPQPSRVDLITSTGMWLPRVRTMNTFRAAASLMEGVSISGFFSACGCCAPPNKTLAVKTRKTTIWDTGNFMVRITRAKHRM